MKRALRSLLALASAALVFSVARPAAAVVAPQGGQAAYEMPLRAFDLDNYRSATTDADRSQAETSLARIYSGTWTVYSWNPQSRTRTAVSRRLNHSPTRRSRRRRWPGFRLFARG